MGTHPQAPTPTLPPRPIRTSSPLFRAPRSTPLAARPAPPRPGPWRPSRKNKASRPATKLAVQGRSATEAAAAAVGMEPAAALLWFFEVARCLVRDTRQPLTRSRCSCEGAQCSCKCKWADARASRPTQRRAAMGAAGGTAPVHGITNASATAPAARLWRLHGRPRRARQQPGSREAIARPI